MTNSDSDHEFHRLAEFYSDLTDGELQNLAADSNSLTHAALRALESELKKRGDGNLQDENGSEAGRPEQRNLITIRKFRDLPDALLAKGSLESAGIECFFADDNLVRMDWFISNLIGGVKLRVNPEDAEDALAILDQPIPESFTVEGVGEYEQPHCPECQSLDTTFEELNKPVAYGSAYLSLPIPLHSKLWKCQGCGHEWQDAGPAHGMSS